MTGAFGEKGHQQFNGVEEFNSKNFDKDEKGFDGEKGFRGGKFSNKNANQDSTNTTTTK